MSPMRQLLTLLCVVSASADGLYPVGSPVTSFTTLSELPKKGDEPFLLLEFYSAWCGHCQRFASVYESVALTAKRKMPKLKVAAVDCAAHADVCNAHDISSYPTIHLWPGEKTFDGAETAEALLEWVRKHASAELLEQVELPPADLAPPGVFATAAAKNASSSSFKSRVTSALAQAAAAQAAFHGGLLAGVGGAGGLGLGDDLMRTAADLGISPQEDAAPHPMLRPRQVIAATPALSTSLAALAAALSLTDALDASVHADASARPCPRHPHRCTLFPLPRRRGRSDQCSKGGLCSQAPRRASRVAARASSRAAARARRWRGRDRCG